MSLRKKGREHKKRQLAFLSKELIDSDGEGSAPSMKKARRMQAAKKQTLKAVREASTQLPSDGETVESERGWAPSKEHAKPEETSALPVRSGAGAWKLVKKSAPSQGVQQVPEEDEVVSEISEDEKETTGNVEPKLSFEGIKIKLAAIAVEITEDSDENVSKIKEILAFCSKDQEISTIRLALLTALAVFKDILPGYYIRLLSDFEQKAKVSKDIKKVRLFEEGILSTYRKFFEVLKGILQPQYKKFTKKQQSVVHVAITCICELINFASHFNFFEDILKLAMFTFATLPWEEELERLCSAFQSMYACDETGKPTMSAVRLLSNMIKDQEYDCPVIWLRSLEAVKILPDIATRKNNDVVLKPKRKHLTGKQKREYKEKQEEMRKLVEAEATVSKEERQKWASETLKHLFRIYFGVLKNATNTDLLPPILAGISKHSNRIGVAYFADLLNSLRRLIDLPPGTKLDEERLDIVSALHCIQTVDRIYAINENLAAMDLKFFYNCLFRQLARMGTIAPGVEWNTIQGALAKCLGALFHPKRHLPQVRLAAFVQRMGDVATALQLTGNHGGCLFMVEQMREIFNHQVRARSVLDREPFGQGAYSPTCPDPDLCNPQSRSLYDVLIALKHSIGSSAGLLGPKLRNQIDQILRLPQD